MTFLELCKETRNRTGISRYGLPTTVTGQVGQLAYLVENVARADLFIQRLHNDWEFLFTEYTTSPNSIAAGVSTITPPAGVWNWDLESFYINKGTSDATGLSYLPYKEFRSKYYSAADTNDTPSIFSIKPGGDIIVNPPPDSGNVFSADYWKSPVEMTVDDSESDIPDKFQQAIVELAVFYYAEKRHDGGLMQSSWAKFQNELKLLEDNQLPERYETNSQPPNITIVVE